MLFLKRQVFVWLLALSFLSAPAAAQAALLAKGLYYHDTGEYLQVVVELNESVVLEETSGVGKRIALKIGRGGIERGVGNLMAQDQLLRQAKLFVVSRNQLLLDIMLSAEMDYTAAVLPDPWRLVVTVAKDYSIRKDETVAPGLTYTHIRQRQKGRVLRAHYLTVEKERWLVRPIVANGEALSRDSLKSMVYGSHAAAAINASYFDRDGWVIGNLKINGEIVAAEERSRTALLLYAGQPPEIALTSYEGLLFLPDGASLPIKGVNRARLADDLVVYESSFAARSRAGQPGCDVLLDPTGQVLGVNFKGDTTLGKGERIISAHGSMAGPLARLKPGQRLVVEESMGVQADRAEHVLGAGPRLLSAGQIVVQGNREDFPSDIINGRAPRTAVGINQKGDLVFFVADGRSQESNGLTLAEAAAELLAFGVVDALNLDGGGSSEMVIGSQVMNQPSDRQERKVSVGLGVFQR